MSFTFTETEAGVLVDILKEIELIDQNRQNLLEDLIEAIEERDLIDFEADNLAIDPEAIAKDNEDFFEILRNK